MPITCPYCRAHVDASNLRGIPPPDLSYGNLGERSHFSDDDEDEDEDEDVSEDGSEDEDIEEEMEDHNNSGEDEDEEEEEEEEETLEEIQYEADDENDASMNDQDIEMKTVSIPLSFNSELLPD